MNATRQRAGHHPDGMIHLDRVTKRHPDGTTAVDTVDLKVSLGEVCVLVGPSGCGKTTMLRMVNRLVEPTSGRVSVDGEDVARADPVALRRRLGYVLQQAGLFPHRTVEENVATVPRLLGWDRRRVRSRVDEMLDLVGLAGVARRYPHQLSGGQQQRVGVARALAADPQVLLMDEPFSAVDPVGRQRLQGEFLRLQAELRKTVVLVTHDLDEAVRLGDRVAVMSHGGRLEQYADPVTLLGSPASPFVADFLGTDRVLRQLAVTPIRRGDLEYPPVARASDPAAQVAADLDRVGARWALVLDDRDEPGGWVSREHVEGGDGTVAGRSRPLTWVSVAATLRDAFVAMVRGDAGWVAVLDGSRFLGVLTPESLHAALRRSIDDSVPETAGAV
jgi:osmoprotectant transport system ATP-binding protein